MAALAVLPAYEGDTQRVPEFTAFTNVNVLPMASETMLPD